MAHDMPDDLNRLISTAIDTAFAFGAALHASPMDVTDLALEFQDRAAAERFRKALIAQRQAYLALTKGAAAMPIDSSAILEAQPTKPLDVEVRQWAVEQAQAFKYVDAMPFGLLIRLADSLAHYALTGTMPPDDPKPQDPA